MYFTVISNIMGPLINESK